MENNEQVKNDNNETKQEEIVETVKKEETPVEPKKEKKVKEAKKIETKPQEALPKKEKTEKAEGTPKKKHTAIIISIILIAAIIIGIALFFIFKTKTIDLSECIKVEYNGYNGHATASVQLDEKKLKEKINDSKISKDFIKKLEYTIENSKNLSNGDEIVIEVKISSSFLKDSKLKLKDNKIKIKVSGIEEAQTIDMSKYIKLEYTGFNKHATAKATLKTDEMKEDLGRDIASKLIDRIDLEVLNNKDLSNKSNVEVKVNISNSYLEEIGIQLDSDTVKIKVEGLNDANELDAFKDIKIDISGMSPNLNIAISNNTTDELLKTVEYKASKTSGVSNGETITITAVKWNEKLFNEQGVALKETTMEYTVKGQAAYIFSLSEIDDTVKNNLKSIFTSKAISKANEKFSYEPDNLKNEVYENTDYKYSIENKYKEIDRDLSFGTPEVASMYLLTKKTDATYVNKINTITAIVKVPCKSAKTGVTYNWYVTIQASNASLKADGTISDNTNYSITAENGKDEEQAYQEYVNSNKNNYNVEKITL